MPDLRDIISPKTSLYRVPGLHDTIALKRLCAVCQIDKTIIPQKRLCAVCQVYVTIFPLKRLCTVSKVYVIQLP